MPLRHGALLSGVFAVGLSSVVNAASIDFGQGVPHPSFCTGGAGGVGPAALCANGLSVLQTYGDVPGVVDVSYSAPRASTGTNPAGLNWWSSGYNNLYGVAFATGSDANSLARIDLRLQQPGQVINLTHFDLGAFPNTTRETNVTITDLATGAILKSFSNFAAGKVSPNTASSFDFTDVSSNAGIRIEFADSALNVGIDNISYTVAAVPEPQAYALMLAGLGLVGYAVRRRRRV
jgi:hypothetical protein